MPELSGEIYDAADKFRRELLRKERAAASRMIEEYGLIWRRLDRQIKDLSAQYYAVAAAGEKIDSTIWLHKFDRLQSLRAQVESEVGRFAQYAEGEVRLQQWEAVQAAGIHTEQMVKPQLPPGVNVGFNRLPREAFTDLVGFLADGSPLSDLLAELGPEAARSVSNALVQGLALGLHPRQIALEARKALGNNLARALRIARTETLRAYREATHRTYGANKDIIGGWIWRSARNVRTCACCWAMDGTEHTIDERLDDHPNGRCFQVPTVRSWKELGFPELEETRHRTKSTGIQAFEKLPEDQKLMVLGPAKYSAYNQKVITLPDLVGRRYSKKWGSMRYEKSMKELSLNWQEFRQRKKKGTT